MKHAERAGHAAGGAAPRSGLTLRAGAEEPPLLIIDLNDLDFIDVKGGEGRSSPGRAPGRSGRGFIGGLPPYSYFGNKER
jgi:hypothetical protein